MNYIDLQNISIRRFSNKQTNKIIFETEFSLDTSVKEQVDKIKKEIENKIIPNLSKRRPNLIKINLLKEYKAIDILDIFEFVSNLICQEIIETEQREREHRLAIPSTLDNCDLKYITLLKMVNYKTKVNLFNIEFEKLTIV